tara:strand:- start:122 stop:364 length:243 start_codon:yes stop_codon:yes gene_type:complete
MKEELAGTRRRTFFFARFTKTQREGLCCVTNIKTLSTKCAGLARRTLFDTDAPGVGFHTAQSCFTVEDMFARLSKAFVSL